MKSFVGAGFHGVIVPPVIQRNLFENPAWYTAYTPYQSEISQGRLELLFHFQTLVAELTGLPVASASLLDEASAVAEAVGIAWRHHRERRSRVVLAGALHPHIRDVVETRGEPLAISLDEGAIDETVAAVIVPWPDTFGVYRDHGAAIEKAKAAGALVIFVADPLALVLDEPPAKLGADIAVGAMQRFGVPMGFGGPHAAYCAVSDKLTRLMPGRLVGQSVDSKGRPGYRLALQTREQHIRRDKATSNICTAQALLANMATAYAVWHGPEGLRAIASHVHGLAARLAAGLKAAGVDDCRRPLLRHRDGRGEGRRPAIAAAAEKTGRIVRVLDADRVGISFDETSDEADLAAIATLFGATAPAAAPSALSGAGPRQELPHPAGVPREPLRDRDDAVPAAAGRQGSGARPRHDPAGLLHDEAQRRRGDDAGELAEHRQPASVRAGRPFRRLPRHDRRAGALARRNHRLRRRLAAAQCRQPGRICRLAGDPAFPRVARRGKPQRLPDPLLRAWHQSGQRQHGRNARRGRAPAKEAGDIDIDDLKAKAAEHSANLAALMMTYPSTHGVFEEGVRDMCALIHEHGGQVYLDGANLNAMVGLARPGDIGADVCHMNLHKTFCIPHGGGGPGVGPIGVKAHLQPFLPGHVTEGSAHAVTAAPFGSASILPITWMYIRMMGASGLKQATETAILNANYIAEQLGGHFPVLYKGRNGRVAHECILDMRVLKDKAGVSVEDVAKRLIDYGFHAPTMSWPVAGTLMVEPTESEPKREIDRFCEAMIAIAREAERIARGEWPRDDNPLANAPHTAAEALAGEWKHPYSRLEAAYPAGNVDALVKYWPPVSRIDNVAGDRNLVCSCPPIEALAS